jgi:lantibiotic leader peptide-processing serine protease
MGRTRWLRRSLALGSLTGIALVIAGCSDRDALAPSHSNRTPAFELSPATPTPESRLVVTLAGPEPSDFAAAVQALGGQVERRHPEISLVTVTGLGDAGAAALAARPGVMSVDRDLTAQWIPGPEQLTQQVADDDATAVALQGTDESGAQFFALQWNMQVISAQAAWQATPAGNGRLVCVLDTGVDPDHIELAGRVAVDKSTSFVAAEPTIQDFNTHGTFVSSIISSNGIRIASVASDARLCAVKVLNAKGSGSFADVIAGILFAASEGADVINMSLGAYVDVRQPGVHGLQLALQRAVDFATQRGVVVVVAAGNGATNLDTDPPNLIELPAELAHVISVGATAPFNQQNFDMLASYSNFGGDDGIGLVAPGGDLLKGGNLFDLVLGACSHTATAFACSNKRTLLLGAGTSFATPHVSGAAAVVASALAQGAVPGRVAACLLQGADNVGPHAIFGAGRLDVAAAARCQGHGASTTSLATP